MLRKSIRYLILLVCSQTYAGVFIDTKKSDRQLTNEYFKLHRYFSSVLCRPGTEETFWKKYKTYKNNGRYVPMLPDGSIDKNTIKKHLLHIKNKAAWIDERIVRLRNKENFNNLFQKIEGLKTDIQELLAYKRMYYEHTSEKKKNLTRIKSERRLIDLEYKLKNFIESMSFLHNYHFPVDHFDLRKSYDKLKEKKGKGNKQKANDVYFYRKIVEDGAHNPQGKSSDLFLRAALDSAYLNIGWSRHFLNENLRYDITKLLESLEKYLKKYSKEELEGRLTSWRERTEKLFQFYSNLTTQKDAAKSFITNQAQRETSLHGFVSEKLSDTYRFWAAAPKDLRAIFVLETILFNEAGSIEGDQTSERQDISHVVINRLNLKEYSQLNPDDRLWSRLSSNKSLDITKNYWLNVMFKEGEFSFTYFFIPSNVRIYCPDMSKLGQKLRKENVKIALDVLRKPNMKFKGIRYFSRASMLGKIDMAPLWARYKAIPERKGPKIHNTKHLLKDYKNGEYTYFYRFTDPKEEEFKVISIRNKTYVMPIEGKDFYRYRNPHYFRYFARR